MERGRGIFKCFVVVVSVLILSSLSVFAISSCQDITSSGTTTLTDDVSGSGQCFHITTNDVIFDCDGFTIDMTGSSGTDFAFFTNATTNVTIEHCTIDLGSISEFAFQSSTLSKLIFYKKTINSSALSTQIFLVNGTIGTKKDYNLTTEEKTYILNITAQLEQEILSLTNYHNINT